MSRDFPAYYKDLQAHISEIRREHPAIMSGFQELSKNALAPGALDLKTKELIALGIAIAIRCDGCIAFHIHNALEAGASRPEILDTVAVAVLMGGGPSLMYSAHVMEALDQFTAQPV